MSWINGQLAHLAFDEIMAKDRQINEAGVFPCQECEQYNEEGMINCGLGYAAFSDCPIASGAIIEILEGDDDR